MTLDDLVAQVKDRRPEGTALDHLGEASVVADHLGELGDHLLGHFVDQARRAGASWTMVGQSMGVTKQAVQKRFVAGDISMDRFTNRATIVVLKAQNDARNRGHHEVTSLHLALGLLSEWEGLAGRAIESAGITKDAWTHAAEAVLPPPGEPSMYHVHHSTGLKKVLKLAEREALRLGHDYVGTEHLLLALLEAREEPTFPLLTGLGLSKAAVEAWTLPALDELRRTRRLAPST